jgi:hypothetical protein
VDPGDWHAVKGRVLEDGTLLLATEGVPLVPTRSAPSPRHSEDGADSTASVDAPPPTPPPSSPADWRRPMPSAAPAPAFVQWRRPSADEDDGLTDAAIRSMLRDTDLPEQLAAALDLAWTGEEDDDEALLSRPVLRVADLPFYRTIRLVQFVDPKSRHGEWNSTWFLLVRREPDRDALEFLVLDGTSTPLHDANMLMHGDTRELQLTDATAPLYLEFFSWAVRGDLGAFLFPRHYHDLPLTAPLPAEAREVLEAHLTWAREVRIPRPLAPPADSTDLWRFETLVAFDDALFRAPMLVERGGIVMMEDDEPLIADMPMSTAGGGATGGGRLRRRLRQRVEPAADSAAGTADEAPSLIRSTAAPTFVVRERRFGDASSESTESGLSADVEDAIAGGRSLRFEQCAFEVPVKLAGRALPSIAFVDCTFIQEDRGPALDLEGATIRGSLILQRCELEGDVSLRRTELTRGLHVAGSSLRRVRDRKSFMRRRFATIQESLDIDAFTWRGQAFSLLLDGAEIQGTVEIGACAGHDAGSTSLDGALAALPVREAAARLLTECERLSMAGARLHSGLSLTGLSTRRLDLSMLALRGTLRTSFGPLNDPSEDQRHARMGSVFAEGAQIDGDLILNRALIDGDLLLDRCHVTGDAILQRVRVEGDLSMRHASIAGWIGLDGSHIGRSVLLHFANLPGFLTARSRIPLRVDGDFGFSGASIGIVSFRGALIRGDFHALNASVRRIAVGPGVSRDESTGTLWPRPSEIGGLKLRHVTIGGDLDIGGTVITGETARRTAPADLIRWTEDDGAVVRLVSVTIAGDVRFAHAMTAKSLMVEIHDLLPEGTAGRWQRRVAPRAAGEATASGGPVMTSAATDVDTARRPSIGDLAATIGGTMQIHACDIGGHLDLRNTAVDGIIDCTATSIGLGIDCATAIEDPIRGVVGRLRTSTACLVLEGASCGGNIDLTGLVALDLRDRERPTRVLRSAREDGSVRARGLKVTGNLLLEPVDAALAHDGLHARIQGELDLSALSANRIVLSNRIFSEHGPDDRRAVLERSHVSRLDIRSPVPALDLSAIRVDRWELGELDDASLSGSDSDRYIAVLRSMTPLDRSVWVQVERELRNGAQDDDANRVYTAMRREARRLRDSPARSALDVAYEKVLGYGTRPLRPLGVSVIGALWLLVTFANPAHVVLADDQVGSLALRCRAEAPMATAETCAAYTSAATNSGFQVQLTAHALGEEWTLRDRVALTLRYAVPIISITTDSDWAPAEARTLRIPGTPWWTSPKALAFCLALYNWLAIPIALGFFSARLIRS